VYLAKGTIAAHMPPEAVGFKIRTPESTLIDQGTEFGVSVSESDGTQVHVFRGQVDLLYQDAQETSKVSRLELRDRQARSIALPNTVGEEVEYSKSLFGSLARRVVDPVEWKTADGGNGHFYQLVVEKQPMTWHEAAQRATSKHFRGMPGHLVTITSSEEDQFVLKNLLEDAQFRGAWMGLTDVLREGHYRWVTGEPYDYTNWASWPDQQPDNFQEADWHGGEDYGMYAQFPGKQPWAWNDLSIDSIHEKISAYLVEYEPPLDALRHRSMALDPIHWPKSAGGNGHYYRIVLVLEPVDWETIRQRATESQVHGTQGHLVAMETAEEREFVAKGILRVCGIPEMMIGLSGSLEHNDLRWVNGLSATNLQVERSHLPTDLVYGVFRWNPAGKWQAGWEIRAMSTDVLPADWFGYIIEYPVESIEESL
ncbi:MAG: lectin-like protein, partial [Lacipirellulaceae bacterium]